MSKVFFRFKAAKDFDSITFDGAAISVFDIKREIIHQKKMGKGLDFCLHVFDANTDEEYKEDLTLVPRSHSVTVKRLPAKAPGKGSANKYVSGVGSIGPPGSMISVANINGDPTTNSSNKPVMIQAYNGPMSGGSKNVLQSMLVAEAADAVKLTDAETDPNKPLTESEKFTKMMEEAGDAFSKRAEEMALTAPKFQYNTNNNRDRNKPGYNNTNSAVTNREGGGGRHYNAEYQQQRQKMDRGPPPANYVCYRCSQKGHWIQGKKAEFRSF